MSARPSQDNSLRGAEWHWLWEFYVAGLCGAAIAAVVLLNERFHANVPVAVAALAGIAACVLAFFRPVVRASQWGWRTVVFLGVVVGLWVLALWGSPAAAVAIPAIYPLFFASLPLPAAVVGITALTVTPLSLMLLSQGVRSPNIAEAVAVTLIGVVAAPVIGIVVVTSMRQRRRLATLVAELAASRANSARLSREAGAAAERERLSREIHDTLAQGFTSIVALAQAVEPELDNDPAAARRHLDLIRATARENLAEARAMLAGLAQAVLGDASLAAAIGRQAERLMAETGITVHVVTDEHLPALGMAADVVLLRCAQEAFNNVRKHSQASAVRVALCAADYRIRLTITDNGVGLPDGHIEGFGLRGMRSRVAQAGGAMSVSAARGGGVTVDIGVPT